MNLPTTLFLHGGPGLSAVAERELHGDSLDVLWWDQPHFEVLFARPYQALLDDAVLQAERLADSGGRKVNLLAHSFGAHLALHLAMQMPSRIGAITLMAPSINVTSAFVRLAERVATFSAQPDKLLATKHRAEQPGASFGDVWALARAICEVPDFLNVYWGPDAGDRQRWFFELIATKPWADLNTCQVILEDFWTQPALDQPISFAGPVTLVFGHHDALVDAAAEEARWKRYFPQAQTRVVNAGHFIQLETPPAFWMPAA